jgi:hypothetical protein
LYGACLRLLVYSERPTTASFQTKSSTIPSTLTRSINEVRVCSTADGNILPRGSLPVAFARCRGCKLTNNQMLCGRSRSSPALLIQFSAIIISHPSSSVRIHKSN